MSMIKKGSISDAMKARKKMASGGSVSDREMPADDMMTRSSRVEEILRKRKAMAEGGEVDEEDSSDHDSENPANMWRDYEEEALKENFSSAPGGKQPRDSNLQGDDLEDSDKLDMVDMIRRKLKAKRS